MLQDKNFHLQTITMNLASPFRILSTLVFLKQSTKSLLDKTGQFTNVPKVIALRLGLFLGVVAKMDIAVPLCMIAPLIKSKMLNVKCGTKGKN